MSSARVSTDLAPVERRAGADSSIVSKLSELATRVQRSRTSDAVLETAGSGILALGMRLAAFQIVGGDLLLRYVATSAPRLRAIERCIGRSVRNLRAPLADWDLVREVVESQRTIYKEDLDLFDRFLRTTTGYDATPLDAAPETAGVTNGVLAPLWVRDRPWGLLLVVSPELAPTDAAALALFATQVGSSVEVAEYIEAVEGANQALAAMNIDLAHMQQELANRERLAALGELAAIVAHEVRNPLAVIFNAVGSLRRLVPAGSGDDAQVLLSIVREEAGRLNRMVTDLLDFARPVTPTIRKGSMLEIIEEAVTAARTDPAAAGVLVDVDVPRTLPDVAMDARYVRQALLNVVLNGLQAMRDRGCLTVRARFEVREQREFVRVDVSDTGPGIPAELQPRVFEPFFTTRASGTGLGLAIVKRILVEHGGDVSVTSSATGTTFSLLLPVDDSDQVLAAG